MKVIDPNAFREAGFKFAGLNKDVVLEEHMHYNTTFWVVDASSNNWFTLMDHPLQFSFSGPHSVYGLHGAYRAAAQAAGFNRAYCVVMTPEQYEVNMDRVQKGG